MAGFVYSMIGKPEPVADICQVVFMKMILQLPKLRERDKFESWLFRIGRNACIDHLRSEKLRKIFTAWLPRHDETQTVDQGWERSGADDGGGLPWLAGFIETLPVKQREILALLQAGYGNYGELAEMTGQSLEAVKSLLFRARQSLKKRREYEQREG